MPQITLLCHDVLIPEEKKNIRLWHKGRAIGKQGLGDWDFNLINMEAVGILDVTQPLYSR